MRKIHFIGICGIGLSGLAKLYASKGYDVRGSDVKKPSNSLHEQFEEANVRFFLGHNADNIHDADIVVYSSIIKKDNVELENAVAMNKIVWSRADALCHISSFYDNVVTVTGAHGKTTTTAMIGVLLTALHKPTILNGGVMKNGNSNLIIGDDKIIVIEADESDTTFAKLNPNIAVVTNVDREHCENYNGFDNLVKLIREYVNKVAKDNIVIVCGDDPILNDISTQEDRVLTYGFEKSNRFVIKNVTACEGSTSFDVYDSKARRYMFRHLSINHYGNHNVSNATAAAIVGYCMKMNEVVSAGLKNFVGVSRRFSIVGSIPCIKDSIVIDDYAHHYNEITSLLSSLLIWREQKKQQGRLVMVFQPHKYSRFMEGMHEVVRSFEKADIVIVLPVYPAGESRENYALREGVYADSETFYCEMIKKYGSKTYIVSSEHALRDMIKNVCLPGDIVTCIGAGNITEYASNLINLEFV